jgi:hypothetical protein
MSKRLIKTLADHAALRGVIGAETAGSAGGAAAGAGAVAGNSPGDSLTKTVITMTNFTIPLVDNAGVDAHGGLKFFDFPAGVISIENAHSALAITKSSAGVNATWNGDFSIGSVVAAADATLTGTEANIIPSTSTPAGVAGVSSANGDMTTPLRAGTLAAALDAYLNVLVDDADHDVTTTPCNLIFNGTITIWWRNLST